MIPPEIPKRLGIYQRKEPWSLQGAARVSFSALLFCIIIKIAFDIDNRCPFIAAAGG